MIPLHPAFPRIPTCAWTRPLGLGWDSPYTVRYASNLDDGPWHGMPLGGFGAGCIGRSPLGDFNLWHVDGGEHIFRSLPGCQFSIFEGGTEESGEVKCHSLGSVSADGTLSTWQSYPHPNNGRSPNPENSAPDSVLDSDSDSDSGIGHPGSENPATGHYHALYPRSWVTYESVFQAQWVCEQFSPIWANNYQETSYPIACFVWTAHNPTDQPLTLSILLTWQNTVGWFTNGLKSPEVQVRDDGSPVYAYQSRWGESGGNFNRLCRDDGFVGFVLDRQRTTAEPEEGDGQWAIATVLPPDGEFFYHGRWNPAGDGAEVWNAFSLDGSLPNVHDETPATDGEQLGVAIALRFTLQPGETRSIPFTVTWDLPVTEFAAGVTYFRRYTDFWGCGGNQAWAIARHGLTHYPTWQTQIQTWQQPILERADWPDWFKMALFNELYLLTDGGTVWSGATERDPYGQFGVLECLDYRWYESLDVRLYGSFALLILWPELDKAVLRAFARAIPTADETPRTIGYYHTLGVESPLAQRKVANATPHDLGAPNEHPWEKTNYTSYQDCNLWKDLASDFVLQVYRDFVLTGSTDVAFLADCWPAVVEAIAYLKTFDLDGDGIPENSGAPDQTFDDWKLQGISAYCGGLWLAALEAAIALGETLADQPVPDLIGARYALDRETTLQQYRTWLEQARPRYQETLWNGQYYRLDSQSGSDVVMADQLCGQFYARLMGLEDIVPESCVQQTLQTIYDSCFLRFNQGLPEGIGMANGVRPDGSPEDPNATHPLEVWTGINFGIAAFFVQMGLEPEAMTITEAVVRQIYDGGLQFRTPEAITANRTFRACHYLRAMAIWGIYWYKR